MAELQEPAPEPLVSTNPALAGLFMIAFGVSMFLLNLSQKKSLHGKGPSWIRRLVRHFQMLVDVICAVFVVVGLGICLFAAARWLA
ncbi:MAG: hypothetical protein ACLGIA_02700 [Actinomycetes bacterium]